MLCRFISQPFNRCDNEVDERLVGQDVSWAIICIPNTYIYSMCVVYHLACGLLMICVSY